MANVVCNVMTAQAFAVWITNFSSQVVLPHKGQIVGHAKTIQEDMLALREEEKQKDPTSESPKGCTADWSNEVHTGAKSRKERRKVVHLLSEFSAMWSAKLGAIKETER